MSNHPELDRIRADLAKARQRLHELRGRAAPAMEEGPRDQALGVALAPGGAPLAWHQATSTSLPLPNGELQWRSQITARETDIARLESELVYAMIPTWGAAAIIERMEARPGAPQFSDVRAALVEMLKHVPDETSVGEVRRNLAA